MDSHDQVLTERLLLRRWRDADRAPFAAMNADPLVMRHFPATQTREQSEAMVDAIEQEFSERGYGLWAVEVDGVFAGFTGLHWASFEAPFTPALEVGWRLAPAYWGKGFATEGARAALAIGLQHEPSIISVTAVVNEPSWRVMERIGLHRERVFDHPRVEPGHRLRAHYLYRTPPPPG